MAVFSLANILTIAALCLIISVFFIPNDSLSYVVSAVSIFLSVLALVFRLQSWKGR